MSTYPPRSAALTLSAEAELVRKALIKKGLETPMLDNGLDSQQKYDRIKALMGEVVSTLGLDLVLPKCMSMKFFPGWITSTSRACH